MNTSTMVYRDRQDVHLLRKVWHIVTGLAVLFVYYQNRSIFPLKSWVPILLFLGIGGLLVDYFRLKNEQMNFWFCKFFGRFMRQSEVNRFSGFPYYALGCAMSIAFYQEDLALMSIYFLILSDPLSSLMGILFGKKKIYKDKSLVGTVTGFVVCFFVVGIYGLSHHYQIGENYILFAFLAAVIGCLVELFSFVDDNLVIPLLSGLGLSFLNSFFHYF